MKNILLTTILISLLTTAGKSFAAGNAFGLGFGGLYGDYGIKLDYSITDSLSIGVLQSRQNDASFTHYTSKYLFNGERNASSLFVTYGSGGIANDQYSELQGTVAGLGYRTYRVDKKRFSEFSVSTILSVKPPYSLITAPVYIGISVGKNF